jgi:hypothetical protein
MIITIEFEKDKGEEWIQDAVDSVCNILKKYGGTYNVRGIPGVMEDNEITKDDSIQL